MRARASPAPVEGVVFRLTVHRGELAVHEQRGGRAEAVYPVTGTRALVAQAPDREPLGTRLRYSPRHQAFVSATRAYVPGCRWVEVGPPDGPPGPAPAD